MAAVSTRNPDQTVGDPSHGWRPRGAPSTVAKMIPCLAEWRLNGAAVLAGVGAVALGLRLAAAIWPDTRDVANTAPWMEAGVDAGLAAGFWAGFCTLAGRLVGGACTTLGGACTTVGGVPCGRALARCRAVRCTTTGAARGTGGGGGGGGGGGAAWRVVLPWSPPERCAAAAASAASFSFCFL